MSIPAKGIDKGAFLLYLCSRKQKGKLKNIKMKKLKNAQESKEDCRGE